jgi:hypothetical protein
VQQCPDLCDMRAHAGEAQGLLAHPRTARKAGAEPDLSLRELGRVTGMSISVHDPNKPPDAAKALLDAMRSAGFSIRFEKFYGQIPYDNDFVLTILYNR